jgi:uncharacterized repeat protein (TIGR01451 family)
VNPPVNPQANLQVTKAASTNAVAVGGLAPFLITITNLGPNTASNITVTDVLPPGLAYSSAGVPGGTSFNETNGLWTIPLLAAGNGYALALTATASNAGTLTNTATLTSSAPPNTNANNSASAVVTVTAALPAADLVVTKAVSTNPAGPYANAITAYTGQPIYFQIGIANAGPANPTNIVINDPLPPGLTYVTSTQYPYNPNTGVWSIGTLVGNGMYFMYLDCVATNQGMYNNIATVPVPSGVTDPNLSNNTASASVQVYQVYSISGYVRSCQSNGPAIPYTTVNLSGAASSSTLTDTNGFY